jgi:chromosome segregation ATPase
MNYTSEIKSLEKTIAALQSKHDALEEKIENRENYFLDRSEKWQESEKGQEHETKTEEMQAELDSVQDVISELEYQRDALQEM